MWLGIADTSFTRQKTVKFGDASAVNSGRLWSVLTLIVLILAWWLATIGGIIDPLFWPPLEGSLYPWDNPDRARPGVVDRFVSLFVDGYRNISLWEHVGTSVKRVLLGVIIGALVGIPLGFAMGLNSVARGLFDPIVEFVRPIPPLALIPLVILWLGIDEVAKIFLLFLAALFIMLIAARAGAAAVAVQYPVQFEAQLLGHVGRIVGARLGHHGEAVDLLLGDPRLGHGVLHRLGVVGQKRPVGLPRVFRRAVADQAYLLSQHGFFLPGPGDGVLVACNMRSEHEVPAVDDDGLSGDIRRRIAGQKGGGIGDVFRFGKPA
jgi:ABC-type nitrate/sulfonate/bicarbonate transport system permease component